MTAAVDISVVVPIHNESENIPLLHDRLVKVLAGIGVAYEILFVNDGSEDDSMDQIRRLSDAYSYVRF
ncbi:MAG: glycosyltransferase, partial [Bacteroidota bacterium]